jgi:hypothetical protein
MPTFWERLRSWWHWSLGEFKATGLVEIMSAPRLPTSKSKPEKKPTPTRRASGHLRGDRRRTSKPRSPVKKD